MTRFRIHQSAEKEGREITFCCNSCVQTPSASLRTFKHLGFKQSQKAGYCSECSATGFIGATRSCTACHGTGVCKNCQGKPYREWGSLPAEDKVALARLRDAIESREKTFSARVRYFRSI